MTDGTLRPYTKYTPTADLYDDISPTTIWPRMLTCPTSSKKLSLIMAFL